MATRTLVIRADASIAIGTGHVMRCLALAQAWQDAGGSVVFASIDLSSSLEQRLRSERFEIVKLDGSPGSAQDASQIEEFSRPHHADWVVVDGYQFDAEYQRKLKDAGLKLLFIDDNGHATHYLADLVLNQNAHASQELYQSRASQTRLLLGPRFALLRREFRGRSQWKREIVSVPRKVLVTMGGSDPGNVTATVIRALQLVSIEKLEAKVIAGASNPHIDSLERAASQSGTDISVLKNVTNMPELMAWADVAISGAGSTCWEMCLLGLPAMVIDLADNQRFVAAELDRREVAIHLGSIVDATPEKIASKLGWLLGSIETRTAMSVQARKLVDGRGAERVISAMRGETLRLRPVEETDCRLLWEWANDADVRDASFSSAAISWDEHLAWFTKKLHDERSLMLIGTDEQGTPIGQIRLDKTQDREADVDLSVAREKRGAGYASCLIEKAVQVAFAEKDLFRLNAFVKTNNSASLRAFEKAKFRRVGTVEVMGSPAVHYMREQGMGNT